MYSFIVYENDTIDVFLYGKLILEKHYLTGIYDNLIHDAWDKYVLNVTIKERNIHVTDLSFRNLISFLYYTKGE